MTALTRGGQRNGDHNQRDRANREINVEDPAPGEVIDKEPSKQGPGNACEAIDCAEHALVATALTWRYDIRNDGLGEHNQSTASQPLQGAKKNQFGHVLADAAQHRANEK